MPLPILSGAGLKVSNLIRQASGNCTLDQSSNPF